MNRVFCYFIIAICLGLSGCVPGASAQVDGPSEIGFVRLLFTDERVTVTDVSTRPGRLKSRRGPNIDPAGVATGQLLSVARSADGEVYWSEVIGDPLFERVEFVNEAGNLETRFIRHREAEITVRIPVVGARQILSFYRGSDIARSTVDQEEPAEPHWQVEVAL